MQMRAAAAMAAMWIGSACTSDKTEDPTDVPSTTAQTTDTSTDTDTDTGTGTDATTDPITLARGGCTATVQETRDGASSGTGDITYDEVGDEIEAYWLGDTYEYVSTSEYGAPHEASRTLFDDLTANNGDIERQLVWEGGHLVEETTDEGADGVAEEIRFRAYDEVGLWRYTHWDYGADGLLDDWNDWTWVQDGDGWVGTGTGLDPEGVYATDGAADASGWMHHYEYDDDRGVHYEWDSTSPNALGYSASYVQTLAIPSSDYLWVSDRQRTFDGLGRLVTTRTETTTTSGGVETVTVVEQTVTYACP
jgi:hypothetical protein